MGETPIPAVCDVIDARQPVFTRVGQLKRKTGKAQWREELKWRCKVPNTDLTPRQIDRRLLEREEGGRTSQTPTTLKGGIRFDFSRRVEEKREGKMKR